ncbi:MAG: hypothetical protein H8E27_11620 [Verrucomicrobia subdivision 3 bacterium]|nr:hypothetical protein [Limisphaerales bacterium]
MTTNVARAMLGFALLIGIGREGGQRGEFMAIFYRHARFEPLETNHFWLSDTPEKVGINRGAWQLTVLGASNRCREGLLVWRRGGF